MKLSVGSLLRWSYRIGFAIAGLAAIVFVVAYQRAVEQAEHLERIANLIDMRPRAASQTHEEWMAEIMRIYNAAKTDEEKQLVTKMLEAGITMREAPKVKDEPWKDPTVLTPAITAVVTTIFGCSGMFIAWRLDRRQSQETSLRIAQLQIDLERSRQVKTEQS